MKIGFVLDDSLDKSDGVQQYVLTLGRWLKSQGHTVHYLVGQTERNDIPQVHSLSRNIQVHFNQNRLSTPLPANRRKIRNLLDQERFDILHVQMPYSPFLAARIIQATDRQTAVVATFHIVPFSRLESMASQLLSIWLRRSLKRIETILSVSEPAAVFLKKTFKRESVIMPNVVSLAHFHAGKKLRRLDDGKKNIVYLGRLVERKGCMELLKAVERLHGDHSLMNVRVLICGKGPLEAKLKKYVSDHHLKNIVTFVGFVDETEKADYLASAHIAVMPSLGGESFGIVLIEAMAAGSGVVIGGDNSGYRTVLDGRAEQLLNPKDTKAFAEKLKHYITNHQARQHAANWQKKHVKNYDVANVGPKIVSYYEWAIAKKTTSSHN